MIKVSLSSAMEKIGNILKVMGGIGTAFHLILLLLSLLRLWLYDINVSMAIEQGHYIRCYRNIYVYYVLGMGIWTCFSLIIFAMGLLILYAVKNEKGKQQFQKLKNFLIKVYDYLYN